MASGEKGLLERCVEALETIAVALEVLAEKRLSPEAEREALKQVRENMKRPPNPVDEAVTRAAAAAAPEQPKPEAKPAEVVQLPKKDGPKKPTADDVRAALKDVAKAQGADAAVELLRNVGKASSVGSLEEDRYAEVIAACKLVG